MSLLVATILTLSITGGLAAVVLFFVAEKFKVYEDPRIEQVESNLPGANCGGCGYPGCHGFAEACVKADSLEGLACPVGGSTVMEAIANVLGREVVLTDPEVAVVRCNGTCENRKKTNEYDGAANCKIAAALYGGDTDCHYGCLGEGDCVVVCKFDAIHMNPVTGLPEVDDDKCVGCGACVTACPRGIIELRKKNKRNMKIFVSCVNKDKGATAKKACAVACIACKKCQKACPHDAITVENNIAYIDSRKCKLCRKCVLECPTQAILEINFPPRKEKPEEKKSEESIKG